MNKSFTKEDTGILKGIAILAMVFHHTFVNNPGLPIYATEGANYITVLSTSAKICVSLLTILSGYGLAESYKNVDRKAKFHRIRFILSHYIQLLSMYWMVFAITFISIWMQQGTLAGIYGEGVYGYKNLIIDLLGLGIAFKTPVLIGGWYLTAIVTFYVIFPVLQWLIEKLGIVIVIICYIPWIYYMIIGDINMHTDWGMFYLCSFALGIYLSEKDLLAKQFALDWKKGLPVSIVFFASMMLLRAYITLPVDVFLSLSIIELEIFGISRIPFLRDFLKNCGNQSANVWLLHGYVGGVISYLQFRTTGMRYVFLVFVCMSVSIVIELIKQGTHYNTGVKKIRKRIL